MQVGVLVGLSGNAQVVSANANGTPEKWMAVRAKREGDSRQGVWRKYHTEYLGE